MRCMIYGSIHTTSPVELPADFRNSLTEAERFAFDRDGSILGHWEAEPEPRVAELIRSRLRFVGVPR